MKRLVTLIILFAMLLTACGSTDEDNIVVSEIPPAKAYISGNGTTVTVTEATTAPATENNGSENTIATFDEGKIAKDESFDINACDDAALLSGEARELDWSMIFDDGCIAFGDVKCPAYIKVSDLDSDFALEIINIGSENSFNPGEFNDYYTLYYRGYNVCGVITSRTADTAPEDAYICTWLLAGDGREIEKEKVGIMGFSLAQPADEVAKVYIPDENDGSDTIKYYGVTKKDGERFGCSLSHSDDFATMLSITPYDINPDVYKAYSDR
ncbi:MAG: hypothetical protein J6A05_05250 [Oscillospiraceae bacterium]|nr:hypothetical protein [Oscillospiraceae bacterium]